MAMDDHSGRSATVPHVMGSQQHQERIHGYAPAKRCGHDLDQKRKVAFALSMAIFTTGTSSFFFLAINLRFSEEFVVLWLRSWGVGFVLIAPVMLVVGLPLQAQIDRLIH